MGVSIDIDVLCICHEPGCRGEAFLIKDIEGVRERGFVERNHVCGDFGRTVSRFKGKVDVDGYGVWPLFCHDARVRHLKLLVALKP